MRNRARTIFLFVATTMFPLVLQLVAQEAIPAEYDVNKPVTLLGAVTKTVSIIPNSRIYMDTKKSDGGVANWAIEVALPETVINPCLPVGSIIKVNGFRAKDGSLKVYGRDITFPDGTPSIGSSGFENKEYVGKVCGDAVSGKPTFLDTARSANEPLPLALGQDNTLIVGQTAVMHIPSDNKYYWVSGKNAAWHKELEMVHRSKNEVIFRAIHPGRVVIILSATGPSGCISCATRRVFIDVVQ